jgi:hypothetical protein
MLGYTRVFYEMQIDIKARNLSPRRTLHRHFYRPKPQLDETGQPKPILVGYGIETQGIRFQLNPDVLDQTFQAILSDDELRLRYRRNFTIYQIAPYAVEWKIFIKTLLDWAEVAVDYWLQEVIPNYISTPRLLDHEQDSKPLITYYQNHGLVRREEVKGLPT